MGRPNESRERILRAAEAEFAERGYFPAAMDAIAERAGVAKGTLYYNFESKTELFVEVVSAGLCYLTSCLREAAEAPQPLRDRLRRILGAQIDMLHQYPKIAAILFREMSSGLDDGVRSRIAAVRGEYEGFIASLLRDGIAEGTIVECDTDLAAATLVDAIYAACDYVMRTSGDKSRAHLFLTTLLTSGLVVPQMDGAQEEGVR